MTAHQTLDHGTALLGEAKPTHSSAFAGSHLRSVAITVIAVFVAVVVTVVVIGGGGHTGARLVSAPASPAPAPQPAPPAPPVAPKGLPSVTIDKSVHYAGFTVTLRSAQASASAADGSDGQATVTVAASFHNSEGDPVNPSDWITNVTLTTGGQSYPGSLNTTSTPGGGDTNGTITFDGVTGPVTFTDAVVTIGDNLHQQARVPLGSSSSVVDLAPVGIPVAGLTTTTGGATVTLKTADISAEVPGEHAQAKSDNLVLHLGYSVSLDGADTSTLPELKVDLQLPDGSQVAPGVDNAAFRGTGEETSPLPSAGTTLDGQLLRFTVPTQPGTYKLVVQEVNADGPIGQPATIAVTVPAFTTTAS